MKSIPQMPQAKQQKVSKTNTKARDKVAQALSEARRLADEGDYPGSLKLHVWFHTNALAVQPSYYGVRLSFALADWIRLGEKYPPAMKKLKAIRNAKIARLKCGSKSRELFHDVVSSNHYLGETRKTVQLFKKIDSENPRFASKVYDLAETALIESKEFHLAKKHLGDPVWRLNHAKEDFELGMQCAKKRKESKFRLMYSRMHTRMFTEDALQIIRILRETGDKQGATEIEKDAQAFLKKAGIRNALKP
jgi:hypothetical protein